MNPNEEKTIELISFGEKASEGRASEGKASEGRTSEGRASEGRTSGGKASEGKNAGKKPDTGKAKEKKRPAKKGKKARSKKKSRVVRRVRLAVVLAILVLLILFLLLFRVTNIVVTGNERYSDAQIKELCINEDGYNNSILFYLFNRRIETDDVPLLDYIDTLYVDRSTIQLRAHEKLTIGMYRVGDKVCCIDQDGVVIEILDYEGSENLNLPLITGLTSRGTVGEVIQIPDYSVLNALQALKSSFDKYDLTPQGIDIIKDEEDRNTYTLHFGDVAVTMGIDDNLEEKMRRVAAIVPQLEGRSGVLHMETFNDSTENIIFDGNAQ